MFLGILVFAVGMASLGAEIAAVRLLAPYFGASTVVWANTIGVVLVALSVGYWLGGRAADRHPRVRPLCAVALTAAVLLAAVPFVARPLLDVGVKALDSVSAGAFAGSLLAVLVLVAIPVLLLGAVTPWALRLAVHAVDTAGTVAGRLYAISTAGSLIGTLLSALLLIPAIGTRRTFLFFAVCLGLVAAAGLLPARRYLVVPAAIAALFALPTGTLKASGDGRVVYERETTYQYARVVQERNGTRRLELNEGHATHSLYRPGSVLTGDYWDAMLALAFAGGRTPRSVAILGNAAGTTARAFNTLFPATRLDPVEIDPELTSIGRRFFGLPRSVVVHHEDARPFLRRRPHARWDAILIDAYRQPYIPFYLVTKEFFRLVRDHLTPGGVVVVNVGHPTGRFELERAMAATMRVEFSYVLRDLTQDTNTQLVASARPPQLTMVPASLGAVAARERARLTPALRGGSVYTDDRAPVEWLIDRSLVEYAAHR
jgi:predicted membrane-bound spermidine synthase